MYHMQKISICLYTDLEDKKPCLWIVNSIATILIRLKLQSKKKKVSKPEWIIACLALIENTRNQLPL